MRSTSQASRYRGTKRGYANPFFPKKKKTPKKKHTGTKVVTICALLIAGFFAFSEYPGLHVTEVEIKGAHLTDEARVGEIVHDQLKGRRAAWLLRNNNTALISKNNIKEQLRSELPVKDVDIQRQGTKKILVTLGERVPIFRLNYPPEHFSVIDEDGLVVFSEIGTTIEVPLEVETPPEGVTEDDVETEETQVEEPPTTSVVECIFCDTFDNLILITVSSTPPILFDIGSSTLPKNRVSSLQTLIDRLASLTIPVDHITITDESPETAQIRVLEGFLVYVDLSKDLESQIANLGALLDNEYPEPPRNLQYIDVRYGNRLYYQ